MTSIGKLRRGRFAQAFSLVEMMVVLAIVMFLLAMVGPRIMRFFGKFQVTATQAILSQIKDSILEYQSDIGHAPKRDEGGIRALITRPSKEGVAKKWRGPYLDEDKLEDKWGNEIIYNSPPEVHKDKYKRFEIISEGPPEAEEGEDIHIGA